MRRYQRIDIADRVREAAPGSDFELSEETIEKLKNYTDVLIAVLKISTILTMAVVAPNAIQAMEIFEKKRGRKLSTKQKQKKLVKTLYYLRREGSIDFKVVSGNEIEIIPTSKGKRRIEKLDLETLSIKKPKKWDGKFWLVAADVPTKRHRRGADALRQKLQSLYFYNLQRSMWFYPYDPRVEVEFISRTYEIDRFITYMQVDQLEPSDKRILKDHFKKVGLL